MEWLVLGGGGVAGGLIGAVIYQTLITPRRIRQGIRDYLTWLATHPPGGTMTVQEQLRELERPGP